MGRGKLNFQTFKGSFHHHFRFVSCLESIYHQMNCIRGQQHLSFQSYLNTHSCFGHQIPYLHLVRQLVCHQDLRHQYGPRSGFSTLHQLNFSQWLKLQFHCFTDLQHFCRLILAQDFQNLPQSSTATGSSLYLRLICFRKLQRSSLIPCYDKLIQ